MSEDCGKSKISYLQIVLKYNWIKVLKDFVKNNIVK